MSTLSLRSILDTEDTILAPGAYDAVSARIIAKTACPIVYISGLGNEASDLGYPDLGLTTATELTRRAGNIAETVAKPVVCDADTGFGGALNVHRTVRLFEAAGVSAIHLEDQTFPKRCGVLEGKEVVSATAFARTIAQAIAARASDEFLIIARSDAKGPDGVAGVIERLKRYADSGADAVMLGDFYTLDEYTRITSEVPLPVCACAADPQHFDRQPDFHIDQWREAGIRVVFHWFLPLFAATRAVSHAVQGLQSQGHVGDLASALSSYDQYAELFELTAWLERGRF